MSIINKFLFINRFGPKIILFLVVLRLETLVLR